MKYSDVLIDLHKLIGLELQSIKPGAQLKITEIDEEKGSILIVTSTGKSRSRPLSEIKRIWDQLMVNKAVHVDRVLQGSGTSRNQPETILANLPYIEWLKIDNKKHISYVEKATHPYGTLKQMDAMQAVDISSNVSNDEKNEFSTAIVSKEVNKTISTFQNLCNGTVLTLEKGIYQYNMGNEIVVFISADMYGVEEGTYCVIEKQDNNVSEKVLCINGRNYAVICEENIKLFVEQ